MKVIYVFQSPTSAIILEKMVIPQIERGAHGAELVGVFFFHDNVYFFLPEHPIGEKMTRLASKHDFFLMCCDYCCEQRQISGRLYPGVNEGCFPDLYQRAQKSGSQQVITL